MQFVVQAKLLPRLAKNVNIFYAEHCTFSALTLLAGQQEGHPDCKKTEWWDAGMVIYLQQGAASHMAQLMLLPLTLSCSRKSRLVLPSRFYLSGAGSPGWSHT